jgi:tetratricopeptide (TPR) repeat protein
MVKQAEADEFRILKAQMDKRYLGKQPRLSKEQMRKRSDLDIEKYNQLAVADEQEMEHEYQSEYRGRVQNRRVTLDYLPMYALSYELEQNQVKQYVAFDKLVDAFNAQEGKQYQLHIVNSNPALDEQDTKKYFALIDSLTHQIERQRNMERIAPLLFRRAVAYSVIQNFDAAIDDLSTYLQVDSTSALGYWQRAVCQSRLNDFNAAQGTDVRMKTANVLSDLTEAIRYGENAYLYYNRGNVYVQRNDYQHAIEDYTRAITLDGNLAEAYYNRGLARIANKQQTEGISDLSKAGELGLYTAYSIIKRYRK